MTGLLDLSRLLASRWNTTAIELPDGSTPQCSGAVVFADGEGPHRFAFVSLGSTIPADLSSVHSCAGGGTIDGYEALGNGEVLVAVWRGTFPGDHTAHPSDYAAAQRDARRRVLTARHGVSAVALEEISNPIGASSSSIDSLAAVWSPVASLTIDVATEITLGTDRQRYVDLEYTTRFQQRATSLAARLAQRGIWSNPLLTMP